MSVVVMMLVEVGVGWVRVGKNSNSNKLNDESGWNNVEKMFTLGLTQSLQQMLL